MNIQEEALSIQGKTIHKITIKNKLGFEVCFCDMGASIFYMGYKNQDGELQHVTVAQKSFEEFVTNGANYNRIIGRVAGRIKSGKCKIQGKDIQLEVNNMGNTLHSASASTGKKIFDYVIRDNGDSCDIHFSVLSPDGESGFIGNVEVEAIYHMEDNEKALSITLKGTPDTETLVNLTNHIYFNLNGGIKPVDDQVLMIDADKVSRLDETLAVLGFEDPIKELDYRKPQRLGDTIYTKALKSLSTYGLDHLFVLNHPTMDHPSVILEDKKLGRKMTIYMDTKVVVVYAENYPFHDKNLAGADEVEGSAITFEPAYPTNEESNYTYSKEKPFLSHTKICFE